LNQVQGQQWVAGKRTVREVNIQRAAQQSGLSADTIRFYEREGVLPRPPRRENGYREYTEDHVATLRLVRGLRETGMPMAEMASIGRAAHDGTCGALRVALVSTLAKALDETDERIDRLQRTRRHVEALMQGLEQMEDGQSRLPGATPCECITLLASAE
jgi:MerR family copper efflux transcriptional regulator